MKTVTITISDQMEEAIQKHLVNQKIEVPTGDPNITHLVRKSTEQFLQEQLTNSLQFLTHGITTQETAALEREIEEKKKQLREKKIGSMAVKVE